MLVKKEEKLKNYELIMALKPLLPDDLRKEMHKEFLDLIKENEGELVDVDVWGKRYLAYDIAGHNEGYYILYNFKLFPSKINEIKRLMQLKQEILRFMVVEVDDVSKIGKSIKKKELEI